MTTQEAWHIESGWGTLLLIAAAPDWACRMGRAAGLRIDRRILRARWRCGFPPGAEALGPGVWRRKAKPAGLEAEPGWERLVDPANVR